MKEFIKIGDYYVKDAQARAGIEELGLALEEVQERIDNLPSVSGALPEVSTADNGKVLQVVDGKWSKATLPTDPSNPSNPVVKTETWTFVLDDGTVVTKEVCLG
jgi:hypothetical protein